MTGDAALHKGDAAAISSMHDVVQVHRNPTSWYNNASFALPLAATVVVALVGLLLRRGDVLAFAGFLGAVTLCMVPVVLVSWRQTATSVVLSRERIASLHRGRVLKSLPWRDVRAVTRRETQGNVRWFIQGAEGERIALDGELEDLDGLIRAARELAGLPESG